MKKIYFIAIITVLVFADVVAQQDPHYTQYMYNMSVMNPAYAGSKEGISGGLLYRKQWVEIEDAPTTGTFFIHSPVGRNVGLGLSAINDKIGPVEETNLYGDFSYTLNLGGEHKLAFGLKAGLTMHKIDFNTIYPTLPDLGDDVFGSGNPSNSFLNIGTGVFYYTNKYYLAFSMPNMLKTKYLDFNGRQYGSEVLHYFLTGGYVFDINENLKFKPFAMVKSSTNAPTSLDLSANFMLYDKLELGATYRLEDSFGAMVNFAITPNLRIGYAYDHIVSDLNVTTPASHEVMLLFDINLAKKVSRSPRFF
ncbi:PorP/SprF family type IX secretion system membrane protein [Flavobacterium capsici]|uniref:Type IX secretion system membrane protein PorP/SprF n=1 Tax=Flavobacterium capsici TaxID=3075618 RepID=A0AA96J5X2_9FLAO|nr:MULTISPECIES: type IX secretion system membrane protein PorP/SprF [unclassified Flavobacterium]WNM19501.1 type IX secretion system membrane protein PorP/SprF [Flavobacterium sp. PMR2A8]WNM20890.1 type IX secretion system membrane protein PorP/SprF [Flavobacterium sp. PMTSA4]